MFETDSVAAISAILGVVLGATISGIISYRIHKASIHDEPLKIIAHKKVALYEAYMNICNEIRSSKTIKTDGKIIFLPRILTDKNYLKQVRENVIEAHDGLTAYGSRNLKIDDQILQYYLMLCYTNFDNISSMGFDEHSLICSDINKISISVMKNAKGIITDKTYLRLDRFLWVRSLYSRHILKIGPMEYNFDKHFSKFNLSKLIQHEMIRES